MNCVPALGAVTSAATYMGYAISTGEGSLSGLIGNTAAGAAVGFFTGPVGLTAMQTGASIILGSQVGFYSGMAGGQLQNALDAAGINYQDGTHYP